LKIVEQSVKLIGLMHPCLFSKEAGDYVTDFDPQKLIEHAGRVCYKSEDKITLDSASKFVEMIAVNQHESVLEHSCASFLIVCDRGVSHEIVRHRIASFSQESTRYCNYGKEKFGKEITVIKPPGLTAQQYIFWKDVCEMSEARYLTLLDTGATPQIARSVLPTCLKTEVVMTANFREWKHFLKLRTSPKAHPQMQEIAMMIEDFLKDVAPTVFEVTT
jgi:thymidylate synthase (FAD)